MDIIVAVLIAVCVIAILFVVHLRGQSKRDSQKKAADPSNPNRFETTLGEFHDMRQALRPLQHTRANSRRVPRQQR
jgi:flagellar basal body-associated protein FliL